MGLQMVVLGFPVLVAQIFYALHSLETAGAVRMVGLDITNFIYIFMDCHFFCCCLC
jgi:uncharacterized membrane protein YecN with MAPEG domain